MGRSHRPDDLHLFAERMLPHRREHAIFWPTPTSMSADAPHDPAVESVKKLSDVGSLVVMSPTPQYRIQCLNQLPGPQRYAPSGKRADLIHESTERSRHDSLTRSGIEHLLVRREGLNAIEVEPDHMPPRSEPISSGAAA